MRHDGKKVREQYLFFSTRALLVAASYLVRYGVVAFISMAESIDSEAAFPTIGDVFCLSRV